MARACSSNSFCHWVIMVTMPVSCGRGLTSLNQTLSPFTNSSTPNRPRPEGWTVVAHAQVVRHGLGDAARLGQRGGRHRVRLPAFHVVTAHLHMADGVAEVRLNLAIGTERAHGELRDFVVEIDETFDDDAARATRPPDIA